MAYEKREWKNDSAPYIDAANLNRMEDGIDGALPKSGGTMTGSLILKGSPTENLEAATKKYVDTNAMYIEHSISAPSSIETYIGRLPCDDFSFDKYTVFVFQEVCYTKESFSLAPLNKPGSAYTVFYANGTGYNKIRIDKDGKVYFGGSNISGSTVYIKLLILPVSKDNLTTN